MRSDCATVTNCEGLKVAARFLGGEKELERVFFYISVPKKQQNVEIGTFEQLKWYFRDYRESRVKEPPLGPRVQLWAVSNPSAEIPFFFLLTIVVNSGHLRKHSQKESNNSLWPLTTTGHCWLATSWMSFASFYANSVKIPEDEQFLKYSPMMSVKFSSNHIFLSFWCFREHLHDLKHCTAATRVWLYNYRSVPNKVDSDWLSGSCHPVKTTQKLY